MADIEFTVKQAAKELHRSERTVRRLAASGRLDAQKVDRGKGLIAWRISAASVRKVSADFTADKAAAIERGQAATLAAEIRSLREEQRQTTELLADRLAKVEQAVLALPPAPEEPPPKKTLWQRLFKGGK